MIELELPYPPSVNHYWRQARGRFYVAKAGVDYRNAVVAKCGQREGIQGAVKISVRAFLPDRRRRDLDNILKSLLDAIVHAGLIEDDSLVMKLYAEKAGIEKCGRVEVTIEQV